MKGHILPTFVACFLALMTIGVSAQTDVAVTYQINARHTGAISTPNLSPPLKTK